ncbi:retrovirus-related pol polyprotein from transposon TNT 1-94 [Tanacetum coccineum]
MAFHASVEKGPLVWPSITEDGVTRLKEYVELTPAEAIQADCDIKAINIILQGLPTEIYALVSQHRVAKDLWEKIKLLMQGTSLTKQERECKLYDEFDKFTYKKGETLHEYYLRFTLLLNDMNIYKMLWSSNKLNTKFLNTLPDEWSKFVTDVKLVKDLHTTNVDQLHAHLQQHERHANEVRLMHERNPDPLALVASHHLTQPAYQSHLHTHPQSLSQHHGRQTTYAAGTTRQYTPGARGEQHCETTDVICYNCKGGGSNCQALQKPNRKRDETWFNDKVLLVSKLKQVVKHNREEIAFFADPEHPVQFKPLDSHYHNSAYQADDLMPYDSIETGQILTRICHQQDVLILSMFDQLSTQVTHCTTVNKALNTELDRYKEEVKDLKEKQNVENSFSGSNEQLAEIVRLKQNLFEQVQEKDCLMKTVSELKNDLKLEENSKIKQLDNIIFKRGQSAQTVHMITKSKICYDHSSKQAIGFEKPFCLKKARESKPKLYDGNTILKMDTIVVPDSDETLELSEKSRSKMLLKEQDPLFVKHKVNTKPINYDILHNDYYKRFVRQTDLYSEHAYWKATSVPALDPSHSSTTVIVLNAKTQSLSQVKEKIKSLNGNVDENTVKMDMDEIETLNIELEHRVTKLVAENEHLKQTYKQLYDSIKPNVLNSVNDQVAKDNVFGDYQIGNVTIFKGAFSSTLCIIRNLKVYDLLTGSQGYNHYTPLSWEYDAILSYCKSSKKPHKPKSEDTNQEKLYLLHMDLCGPMRVASVNGKKYILVIVDDYSRFTWTLREYNEKVGFSHETSVARSTAKRFVERQESSLIEAAPQ